MTNRSFTKQRRGRSLSSGRHLQMRSGWLRALVSLWLVSLATLAWGQKIELANGDVYEGELVEGLRSGQGTYLWAEGNKYEGEFAADRLHGKGTYTWVDGRTYTGDFVNDRREGKGIWTWVNGDRYEGEFTNNQMHGDGKFTWANQDSYNGAYVEGRRTGHGTFSWEDGREYVGAFLNGKMDGEGVFSWPNGNRYVGTFVNDQRAGDGVFYWRDGTIYRGQFQDSKMHGWGVKKQPEGSSEVQLWRNGALDLRQSLASNGRCSVSHQDRSWMFDAQTCLNGLAHGVGMAASLDGNIIIPEGRFVLGKLVSGSTIVLPSAGTPSVVDEGP